MVAAGIPINKEINRKIDYILYKRTNKCFLPVGVKVKDGTVGKENK